jgi:hypothetical protein
MGEVFSDVQVLELMACDNMTVFPLKRDRGDEVAGSRKYLLAAEAMQREQVDVEEVNRAGSVPHLLVKNRGDQAVLFVEGEELVGAKQNRVLNTTVLVGANTDCVVPVSCIEAGRWHDVSQKFGSGAHVSPSTLRRKLKRAVMRSIRQGKGHRSDQAEVWDDIARQQMEMKVSSASGAMSDSFLAYARRIQEFREQLPWPKGAEGLVVAIDDEILGMDLFDSHEVCQQAWPRLLGGYGLDALRRGRSRQRAGAKLVTVGGPVQQERFVPDRPDQGRVEEFLEQFDQVQWQETPAVGEGREFRTEIVLTLSASSLYWNGVALHTSAAAEVAV